LFCSWFSALRHISCEFSIRIPAEIDAGGIAVSGANASAERSFRAWSCSHPHEAPRSDQNVIVTEAALRSASP
jgi:hypothetical protein